MRNKNKRPLEDDNLSGIKKNKIDNLDNTGNNDSVNTLTTTKPTQISGIDTGESDNKNNNEKFFTFTFYKVDPKCVGLMRWAKMRLHASFLNC